MKPLSKVFVLVFLLIITACENHRESTLPDGAAETLFSIEALKTFKSNVIFEFPLEASEQKRNYNFPGGDTIYKMKVLGTPNELTALLHNAVFPATKGLKAKVRLEVSSTYITVVIYDFKAAPGKSLPNYFKLLPSLTNKKEHFALRFPVQSYGHLIHSKTTNGEDTNVLRLQKTAFEKATHVQFDPSASQRQVVSANPNPDKKIFTPYELNGKFLTLNQVQSPPYSITIEQSRLIHLSKAPLLFKLRFDSRAKLLFVYQVLPDNKETRSQVSQDPETGKSSILFSKCNVKRIPFSYRKRFGQNCFAYRNVGIDVTYHQIQQSFDTNRNKKTTSYSLKSVQRFKRSTLISIGPSSRAPEIFEINENTVNLIKVSDFKNDRFLYQRTLQENSSNFPYAFTGLMGPLEIVEFQFGATDSTNNTSGQALRSGNSYNYDTKNFGILEIKRSKPLTPSLSSTELDREALFRFNVQYVKKFKSPHRNDRSLWRRASVNDPQAHALLNWSENLMSKNSESASFKILGEICLGRAKAKEILPTAMVKPSRNRTLLSFTMRSTRSIRGFGCIQKDMIKGGFPNFNLQTSFNFLERFSFIKYNPENSKKVISTIPPAVQRKFGLSFFTQQKVVPDKFNQRYKKESLQSQGILHDFSNGKTVTWILTSLPKNPVLKQKIIDQTELVTKNWNKGLARAFKGTALDRSRRKHDYVYFTVDKDNRYKPYFGDLNYNFIYYESKSYATPVVGIALMGVNQESGLIERANTVIYGGSIENATGSLKMISKAHKDYQDSMNEETSLKSSIVKPVNLPRHQLNAHQLLSTGVLKDRPSTPTNISRAESAAAVDRFDQQGGGRAPIGVLRQANSSNEGYLKSEMIVNIFKNISKVQIKNPIQMKSVILDEVQNYLQKKSGTYSSSIISEIGSYKLQTELNELMIQRLNQFPGIYIDQTHSELSPYHKNALKLDKFDLMAKEYGSTLVHELGHLFGLYHNFYGSYDRKNWLFKDETEKNRAKKYAKIKTDKEELFKLDQRILKQKYFTCGEIVDSHPIDFTSPHQREFSTVMDYMPLRSTSPGPWDIATIRLAYTGYLELSEKYDKRKRITVNSSERCNNKFVNPDPKVLTDSNENPIAIKQGHLIHIKDYMKKYGLLIGDNPLVSHQDWDSLLTHKDEDYVAQKYLYCDNSDEYLYSACNMHDQGTTPYEIVNHYIKNYQAYYHLRNLPNVSGQFNWRQLQGYIFARYYGFHQIRQFLDETFYESRGKLTKKSGVEYQASGDSNIKENRFSAAVILGRNFFHSIIRTPEISEYASPNDRFRIFEHTDAAEKTYREIFEAKWTSDAIINSRGDLAHRGIEYDKALAIMFLTQRGLGGIPEFEKDRIWVSYADFEKREAQEEALENLPTIRLVTNIMSNNLKPAYLSPTHGLVSLENDPYQYTHENMLVRQMAAYSAGMSLQVSSLEASDNFARLFYFNNSANKKAPDGVDVITALGESPEDPTTNKYWTTSYAKAAQRIFRTAINARDIIEKEEDLVGLLTDIFNLDLSINNNPNLNDERLSQLKALIGPREDKLRDQLEEMALAGKVDPRSILREMYQLAERARKIYVIESDYMGGRLTEKEFFDLLIRERAFSRALSKASPILMIAHKALLNSMLPVDIKSRIRFISDPSELKRTFFHAFGNIRYLRKLNYYINEE